MVNKNQLSLLVATIIAGWTAGAASSERNPESDQVNVSSDAGVQTSRTRPLTGIYGAVTPTVLLAYRVSAFLHRKR